MPLKLSEKNIVGLNQLEVKKYLDQFGTNEIYVKKKLSWLQQLWRLFKNPLVIILLVAAIL